MINLWACYIQRTPVSIDGWCQFCRRASNHLLGLSGPEPSVFRVFTLRHGEVNPSGKPAFPLGKQPSFLSCFVLEPCFPAAVSSSFHLCVLYENDHPHHREMQTFAPISCRARVPFTGVFKTFFNLLFLLYFWFIWMQFSLLWVVSFLFNVPFYSAILNDFLSFSPALLERCDSDFNGAVFARINK